MVLARSRRRRRLALEEILMSRVRNFALAIFNDGLKSRKEGKRKGRRGGKRGSETRERATCDNEKVSAAFFFFLFFFFIITQSAESVGFCVLGNESASSSSRRGMY